MMLSFTFVVLVEQWNTVHSYYLQDNFTFWLWQNFALNTLVHRFHQLTSWCPCPYFQFSRCAIPSICEFSMLVSFLPRELKFCSCCFNQIFILCFISRRRSWNSAATDNGLWHMLYSNLFDCHNLVPGEEQDNKLVHENEDGHTGTNPVIHVNWLKAFRRRCKGKTPYIWYNFFLYN